MPRKFPQKFSVQGAFSNRIPDKKEDAIPRFRRRSTSQLLDADYVYGIAHKVHPQWLVICPGKWWTVMDDRAFGEDFVASNREGRIVANKIMQRRPEYRAGYMINVATA